MELGHFSIWSLVKAMTKRNKIPRKDLYSPNGENELVKFVMFNQFQDEFVGFFKK